MGGILTSRLNYKHENTTTPMNEWGFIGNGNLVALGKSATSSKKPPLKTVALNFRLAPKGHHINAYHRETDILHSVLSFPHPNLWYLQNIHVTKNDSPNMAFVSNLGKS